VSHQTTAAGQFIRERGLQNRERLCVYMCGRARGQRACIFLSLHFVCRAERTLAPARVFAGDLVAIGPFLVPRTYSSAQGSSSATVQRPSVAQPPPERPR
jgi:hypothetical protein